MANATADRTTDDLYFGGRTIARSPARGGGGGHAASRGPRARCRAPAHAGLVVILPSFLLHRASVFAETHGVLDTKEIVRKMKIQIWNFAEALTSLGSLGSTLPSSCLFFSDRVDRRGQRTWTLRWRGRRRSGGGGGRGGWMEGGRERNCSRIRDSSCSVSCRLACRPSRCSGTTSCSRSALGRSEAATPRRVMSATLTLNMDN